MYAIAATVAGWLGEGRPVQLAQVVATRGFSSRDPGAALAWTADGAVAGGLFPSVDRELRAAAGSTAGRLAEFRVSDAEAVAASLSCGGVATVLVQDAAALPAELWQRLARREPVCLVTELTDTAVETTVYLRDEVTSAVQHPGGEGVPRLFARGSSATALTGSDGTRLAVVALWPTTTLVVVGAGAIADALVATAAVLGWTATVTEDPGEAAGLAGTLAESDAVLVLSHDRSVDVPALAAALAGRVGYLGALGSRATQAARRDGLLSRGVGADRLGRIHGPAGLDIGAHSPGEIAVSIAAEVLATRAGAGGGSLRDRRGPVHSSGVHAPPPRY